MAKRSGADRLGMGCGQTRPSHKSTAKDHPPHRAVHVHPFTDTCEHSRQLVLHVHGRQHAGHPEDKSQVVEDDHHDIDRKLRSYRGVGLKVEGAIEHVAECEGERVSGCDSDRHREAEPAVQASEDQQIDAESEAVDETEAKKCRRDN